tara:strand:+ start:987 stop:3938 length:2952 start_codon:yes stop_codon:yes gene_type:complete
MPKQTHKIEGFHGGLNSNADPRDIREFESPSLQDVAIDSVGRLKTLGGVDSGTDDSNTIAISKNKGLFVMSSDRQLDAGSADETLIFCFDSGSNTIDIKDSEGWDTSQINLADVFNAGTAQAGASTTITLASGASSVDDYYNGYIVTTTGGTGPGQERLITDYVGSTRVATVAAWGVNPSSDTTYKVGLASPVYYAADGVVRVSDNTFQQSNQWFGYISDEKFDGINADSGAIGWYNIEQSLATPTLGTCIISTPTVGSDSNGIFSAASEYIGDVIDDGTSDDQVVDHSSVNLRVGVQYNQIIASGHADWDYNITNCANPSGDSTDIYPCIGTAVTKIVGSSTSQTYETIGVDGLSYTVGENECLIFSVFMTTTEYNKLSNWKVAAGSVEWTFGAEQLSPNKWNLLVCSSDNISGGSENFPITSAAGNFSFFVYDNQSGTNDKPDYYVSGVAIAEASGIDTFTPGVYTFHHTYLYDAKNEQESLPFTFNSLDTGSEPDNVNSINVAGSNLLFNFDTYICSNVSAGNAYGFNKRISGSRLYWKVEENDNYFLIGQLDFIGKGFKWTPEADTNSYDMSNTTDTTAPILSKTAIIKGISPDSANIVDTFKSINGFSSEVDSLDAFYKTAVVHGRRAYIGNIKQTSSGSLKTHPDRILKSQINRFDTFPEGMGGVDVVIRDGENIVKLEAYADRILQFKEHSLYIINVSETVDFLEDTYRNKGCAFDYHVTKTDMGICWFNDHGVYLYDGKNVNDLLEKDGMRLINEDDWSTFIKDGTDDTDMSSALIGYIPKKKQILIKNENNDVYVYDFVLRAWTTGSSKITESTAMTNFALDADQNLFYIDNTTTVRKTWQSSPQSTTALIYQTPDIDFGQPSVRKKIYRIRISYKGDADNLVIKYGVNGDTDAPYDFEGTNSSTGRPTGSTASSSKPLHDKTDLTTWHHAELKPDVSSEANNVYSFQLHMTGQVDSDFEVNDITIIYRMKNVR